MQGYEQLGNYPIPIGRSVNILTDHLEKVDSVTAWAKLMGYSRSYFSTSFSEYFGETPSECLCRMRYRRLHKIILQYPHKTSQAIAQKVGLQNQQSLYKFLNRHYGTNFTEMRSKLLNGFPPPEASE